MSFRESGSEGAGSTSGSRKRWDGGAPPRGTSAGGANTPKATPPAHGKVSSAATAQVSDLAKPAAGTGKSNHPSRAAGGGTAPVRAAGSWGAGKPARSGWKKPCQADAQKTPDPILFQTYFKSVGPRTYAAQLKRAGNGNHYLVFTEGKRDKVTDEVRKTSVYVFSEDFVSFFKMLKETAEYVKAHPLPAEVSRKRAAFWEKEKSKQSRPAASVAGNARGGETRPSALRSVRTDGRE